MDHVPSVTVGVGYVEKDEEPHLDHKRQDFWDRQVDLERG